MTITKKMAVCRFYRDPLRKVDFMCEKSHKINKNFWASKLARVNYYSPKRMLVYKRI